MKDFRHVRTEPDCTILFSYGNEYIALGKRNNKICVWNYRNPDSIIDRNLFAAFSLYFSCMMKAAKSLGYDVNVVPVHSITIDEDNVIREVSYFDKSRLQ